MHRYLFCLVLLCACPVHAQTLHKCSGQGGAIAYRDGDCLPGERLVAVRDAAAGIHQPERARPAPRRPARPSRGHDTAADYRKDDRRRGTRGHAKPRKSRKDPCKAAKQARDDFQRKRRARMTMEQLSRWSHRVYDACK